MYTNYFQFFNLPVSFQLDLDKLERAYQKAMQQVHPDRQEKQELQQRLALQYTAWINQAYHCLKDPMSRAIYLAEQAGITIDLEHTSIQDMVFLEQFMTWQEDLLYACSVKDHHQINALKQSIDLAIITLESKFLQLYSELLKEENLKQKDNNTTEIIDVISKMRFLYRLKKRLDADAI